MLIPPLTDKRIGVDDQRNAAVAHYRAARKTLALDFVLVEVCGERLYDYLLLADKFVGENADALVVGLHKKQDTVLKVGDLGVYRELSCMRRIG